MLKTKDFKRENFDISPEQQAEIECLQDLIHALTRKDAILTAIKFTLQIASELKKGNRFYIEEIDKKQADKSQMTRIMILGLNSPTVSEWKYLVEMTHPWRRQLYVKGRKLPAATVWNVMKRNGFSRKEAAHNWDLPIEAIDEIVSYCESNKKFLELEAAEEKRRLKGNKS